MSSNEILIQCQAKVSFSDINLNLYLQSITKNFLEQCFPMQPGSSFSQHQMQQK
jgi:hypothetical protein